MKRTHPADIRLLGWLGILWIFCFCTPQAYAASPIQEGAERFQQLLGTEETPWVIQADKLTYAAESRTYEAEGHVIITSGEKRITADWAQVSLSEQQAKLVGNVHIQYGRDWLTGERVIWNLDTQTGWVDGGTVYFSENGFYVRGKNISKRGPDHYHMESGIITTCDPSSPDWAITCRDLDVKVDGTGWAKHSALRIGGIPVLYTPIAYFPVNRHRQSGLLLPTFGSSDLNGIYYEQPFFWAARQDMDFTFYAQYLEERGLMGGMEYRIHHARWGKGIWLANFLDDQADKGHLADYGYPFQKRNRYWIRARHTMKLPYDVDLFLDLDFVSDRNFLKEFQAGSADLDETNRKFRKVSRRELLNDESVTARESSLYLLKRGETAVGSLDVHYWDQLDRSLDETTLQQLPQFRFSLTPTFLSDWPVYYSLDTSAVHYWRPEGDRGFRLDFHPRLSAPIHFWPVFVVEPSAGLRGTLYQVDWQDSDENGFQSRWIPDLQIEASSRLQRVFRFGAGAVQHVVRPEVRYVYVPDVDQEDLPRFDGLDRIPKQNTIYYGVSTFLTLKKEVQPEQGEPYSVYHEMGRLRLSQAYLVEEDVQEPLIGTKPGKRFSDISLELDLTPEKYLNLSYDLLLSPHDQRATLHDLTLGIRTPRNDSLHITYRYREDTTIDEIIAGFRVKVLPQLTFSTYYDYSFDQDETFKQTYSLNYRHGCWGIRFSYREEAEDREFSFALTLVGLGELGSAVSEEGSLSLISTP